MSFENIKRLNSCKISENQTFFIDANIWIFALLGDDYDSTNESSWQKADREFYKEFFYNIVDSESDSPPKILMPTVLFTEIVSVYMHKFHILELPNVDIKDSKFHYKRDYRNTLFYIDGLAKITSDINSFSRNLLYISDAPIVKAEGGPLYIDITIPSLDPSDFVYYRLVQQYELTKGSVNFITDDHDFKVPDLSIYTLNQKLLAKKQV